MRTLTKITLTLAAIAGGVFLAFLVTTKVGIGDAKTIDKLVTASMNFNNPNCAWPEAVEVSFKNNSSEDINWLSWRFSVNAKGHSSELISIMTQPNNDLGAAVVSSTDLIIEPGKTITVCSSPPLRPEYSLPLNQVDIRMNVEAMTTASDRYDQIHPRGFS